LNIFKSYSNKLAALGLAGELVLGSLNNIISEKITVFIFIIGDHLFYRTSKHIVPFSNMLGWKTKPGGKVT
jgi:hypothetical protein